MKKTALTIGLALAISAFSGSAASAATVWLFDADDLRAGRNSKSQVVDLSTKNGNISGPEVTVTSKKNLKFKNTAIGKAIGTNGGVRGEIDTGPSVFFDFDREVFFNEFTVAWLFPDGQYGDKGDEVALFKTYDANDSLLDSFTLRATDFTTGAFSGVGTVENLHIAKKPGDGVWKISGDNIFGNFSKLELSGSTITNNSGKSSGSDFSFFSAQGAGTIAPVPVPAALPLLASALGGLGLLSWRRKQNAA